MLVTCYWLSFRSGVPRVAPGAVACIFVIFVLLPNMVFAGEWTVKPHLNVSEVYTDNVTLAPANEEEEYGTRIRPGVIVHGKGRRLQLDLDYTLDSLFYIKDSARNNTNNQLQASALIEAVKDTLSFDASSSISQQIINADDPISLDNINPGNRTDVNTYNLGPSYRQRLGQIATVDLEYRYGAVNYKDTDTVSDTVLNSADLGIANGPGFTKLSWQLNYHNDETDRESGADSKRERSEGDLRYQLDQSLSLVLRGGTENNEIATSGTIVNDSYYSAGLAWTPSPKFSLDGTYGELNKDANIKWNPISRTSLVLSYQDRDVGLNLGSFWSGVFHHRTRRTTWQVGYDEDTTNTQRQQQTDSQFFLIIDPNTGLPAIIERPVFSLTDEEFLSKRAYGDITLKTGKSDLGLHVYSETRAFQLSGDNEEVNGWDVSWNWRFASRTSMLLSGDWSNRVSPGNNRDDDLWHANIGITRKIRPDLSGSVEYKHAQRNSILPTDGYRENRVTVELEMRF